MVMPLPQMFKTPSPTQKFINSKEIKNEAYISKGIKNEAHNESYINIYDLNGMHLQMHRFIRENNKYRRRQSLHPAQSSASHLLCEKLTNSGTPRSCPLSLPSSGRKYAKSQSTPLTAVMNSEGRAMMTTMPAKWTVAAPAQLCLVMMPSSITERDKSMLFAQRALACATNTGYTAACNSCHRSSTPASECCTIIHYRNYGNSEKWILGTRFFDYCCALSYNPAKR